MARDGSVVAELVRAKTNETIAQGRKIPFEVGDTEPRLRPEDLPKSKGEWQNRTVTGRLYELAAPDFTNPRWVGKQLLKKELLARKGVDVDSDTLYHDGETKDSLSRKHRGGQWANPYYFKKLEKEMEAELERGDGPSTILPRRDHRT